MHTKQNGWHAFFPKKILFFELRVSKEFVFKFYQKKKKKLVAVHMAKVSNLWQ